MAQTNITTVTNQIQKFWSSMFMDELRAKQILAGLVNKDYDGEIKKGGDTVRVSQINAGQGEIRTIGTDADSYNAEQLSTSYVDIKADKRISYAIEFDDLSGLQSQIDAEAAGGPASDIRKMMLWAVGNQLNSYLYSKVAPSASSPDHVVNNVADFNKAALLNNRLLSASAKWDEVKGWWILADPSYYNDVLNDTTMVGGDYVNDKPTVGGKIITQRYGYNIVEDNSISTDQALIFHPDFLHLVMQKSPTFKISDLHAQKKFGYVISVDLICGATLGIDGAKKHILNTAHASNSSIVMV